MRSFFYDPNSNTLPLVSFIASMIVFLTSKNNNYNSTNNITFDKNARFYFL